MSEIQIQNYRRRKYHQSNLGTLSRLVPRGNTIKTGSLLSKLRRFQKLVQRINRYILKLRSKTSLTKINRNSKTHSNFETHVEFEFKDKRASSQTLLSGAVDKSFRQWIFLTFVCLYVCCTTQTKTTKRNRFKVCLLLRDSCIQTY